MTIAQKWSRALFQKLWDTMSKMISQFVWKLLPNEKMLLNPKYAILISK